jgi:hypothetical protein
MLIKKPYANSLDVQDTAECFYRLQQARNLAIIPDIQLIIYLVLNPDVYAIVVFGLNA